MSAADAGRRQLSEAVAQLDLLEVLDALGHSIVVVANRDDLPIVYVNPAFEQTTGWSAAEVLGENCRVLQGDRGTPAARAEFRRVLDSGLPGTVLVRNERPDGRDFWNEVVLSPIRKDGEVTHFIGVQRDVSERVEAQEQVRQLAERDALTGLSNRRRLERWLRRAAADGESAMAVLYMDVDAFKSINDSLGHDAGDEILRQLSVRLIATTRPTDLLGRVGGDEFVIAMAPGTGAQGAQAAAERVLESAREPFRLAGMQQRVTLSVGVADAAAADPLQAADAAMYRVKRRGGDGWALAGPAAGAGA